MVVADSTPYLLSYGLPRSSCRGLSMDNYQRQYMGVCSSTIALPSCLGVLQQGVDIHQRPLVFSFCGYTRIFEWLLGFIVYSDGERVGGGKVPGLGRHFYGVLPQFWACSWSDSICVCGKYD